MMEKVLKKNRLAFGLFIIPIVLAGLFTMKSFTPQEGMINFFDKQIVWIIISFCYFFVFFFY